MINKSSCGLILVLCMALPVCAETSSVAHKSQAQNTTQQIRITSDLPFSRLFTTPEQRKILDSARRQGGSTRVAQLTGVDENTTNTTLQPNRQTAQPFKLSGVLLRADGQHQVWVSGEGGKQESPAFGRKILGDVSQSANVKVPLQGTNQAAILKPGQVWIPDNHRAEESYRLAVPKPVVAPEPIKKAVAQPIVSSVSAQASTSASSGVHSSVQSSSK